MEAFRTPLYELMQDGQENRIFIKREDLLPFSLGGNKVRIAESFFCDMEEKHCDALLGYGDLRSNLCRVLANRCFQKKIPCRVICTGADDTEGGRTANSLLMKAAGAVLVFCRKTEIAQTVEREMEGLRKKGLNPYYIYGSSLGTGNEGVAAEAYVPVYREILQQGKCENVRFDYLFLPSGTGATQSGLVCGHLLEGDEMRIVGISVSRERKRGTDIIACGVKSWFQRNGRELPSCFRDAVELEDGFRKGGYGCWDGEIAGCIREVFLNFGVPLDPTYTGKAFAGMRAYLKRHGIRKKNILFLHTGGTPLFYDAMNSGIFPDGSANDTKE